MGRINPNHLQAHRRINGKTNNFTQPCCGPPMVVSGKTNNFTQLCCGQKIGFKKKYMILLFELIIRHHQIDSAPSLL